MTNIAFLGLGLMGRGMALNLIKAGYDVTVWNRSPDKLKPLVDAGAISAETPSACASGADVIITIVGGDEASESVWLGEDGILSGALKPNAIAIESTTVSRDWMVALGEKCLEIGLRFLDCPVTGGPPGAESGQLTMLVGGEAEALKAAEPVLDTYSKRIYHFGAVGAGTAYKLIVNTIGAIQAIAVAEGMQVAERAGLNLDTVAEALGNGSVASPMTTYIAPRMARDDHGEVRFAARWRGKDAGYGAAMSQDLGCTTPMFDHAARQFRATIDLGMGDANKSAVMRVVQAGED